MSKDCSTCKKYCYEFGIEDNDEYCSEGIDLNTVPEGDTNFTCTNYEKGEAKISKRY